MTIRVRERTDTKTTRWQVDGWAMLPGATKAQRFRYTAPRSITSKSGALRWGEQVRRDIEAGKPPPQSKEGREAAASKAPAPAPAPAVVTLRDGAEVYFADSAGRGNCSATLSAQRTRLANLVAVIGDAPLATLGEAEASKVRTALRASMIATTINGHLRLLRALVQRCHELGHRPTPCPRLEMVKERRVKVPRAYDDPTFELLAQRAAPLGAQHLGVVLVCGEAALRVSELRGLEIRDIDAAASALRVERSVNDAGEIGPPKNGEARTVPLTPRTLAVLLDLAGQRGPSAPVFIREDETRVTRATVRSWLVSVQTRAGLPPKGVHTLRHSAASSALAGGADVVAVQKMLGHTSLQTTVNAYLHDTGDAPARAVKAISSARGAAQAAGVTDLSRVPHMPGKRRRPHQKPKQ